ncbi:MAG: hypothetical protein JW730_18280 [Anaerolineales bacterium]|nr:hypothetical protein [Anaerolineales bacterium]
MSDVVYCFLSRPSGGVLVPQPAASDAHVERDVPALALAAIQDQVVHPACALKDGFGHVGLGPILDLGASGIFIVMTISAP